jgi:hypothetical protein
MNDRRNTVLNWHRAPEEEFDIYAKAYWDAAQTLVKNVQLDQIYGYDACPLVFLYRHALELYLKAILLGDGAQFLPDAPGPESVMGFGHSLKKLVPHVRKIFEKFAWGFSGDDLRTFEDFEVLVDELHSVDEGSYAFRYPTTRKLKGALSGHFTFNAREFARKMDEALTTLAGACDILPELYQSKCEAAYCASAVD